MQDPLSALFSLEQFGIKFGLDNMRAIVEALGHPERTFHAVHIAGTNGKGSVTAMVDRALGASGYRSARYTSPHLVRLEERFTIGGNPVEHRTMIDAVARVLDAVDALTAARVLSAPPTFFEATTAVAFELFRRANVETAVLEVGLGGRLDATNIVTPAVCAITSIAFDHQQYLGSTLREIAAEKAGIIKTHVPVVVGELEPEAFEAIAAIADERNAPIIQTSPADVSSLTVGLAGRHQRANAAIANGVLNAFSDRGVPVTAEAIAIGIADPRWPGRLDVRRRTDGREAILDAAHNPAGAAALASYLHERIGTRLPLVFGVMRDKDASAMLRALGGTVSDVILTRATTSRSAELDGLAQSARAALPGIEIITVDHPIDAVEAAWMRSPRIVVAGSIFLLGEVMEAFGWS